MNLQNLDYDDLDLVVFANDQEIGVGKLSFMDIVTSPRHNFSKFNFMKLKELNSDRMALLLVILKHKLTNTRENKLLVA